MICLGFPTLNRYDLLDKAILSFCRGTVVPDVIYVIDNGGNYKTTNPLVRVIKPVRNIGVAASWNLLHRVTKPNPLVISNDDLIVAKHSLEEALSEPYSFVGIRCLTTRGTDYSGWSCFFQREEVWKEIGDYDEEFYPAYFEDNDYAYRMKLKSVVVGNTRGEPGIHQVSATRKSVSKQMQIEINIGFERNKAYYIRKWGGTPGEEVYLTPFDGNTSSLNH